MTELKPKGLKALIESVKPLGKVVVVAPADPNQVCHMPSP